MASGANAVMRDYGGAMGRPTPRSADTRNNMVRGVKVVDAVVSASGQQNVSVELQTYQPEPEPEILSDAELDEIISGLTLAVNTLQQEIEMIVSEMTRCQKAQRTAKALTIVGGLGVLGTVVGAAVQGAQIKSAVKEQGGEK